MRFIIAILLMTALQVQAKIHTENIEYNHGNTPLEGYLAYDDALQGPRPGVMIVHEWNGLGDYVKMRADSLAKLGYIAFAIDMYGKGIRPTTAEESQKQATIYRSDRALMRARAAAGLDEFRKNKLVDSRKIAVIGYCFGGGVALELARSGADIAGVVSFHGNLDTPNPADAKNIKCRILVCHGGNDPFVTREQVNAFWDEMTRANVDWQLVVYDQAVHGFTNPLNGNDPSKGAAYDEKADHRSWEEMQRFFDQIFK